MTISEELKEAVRSGDLPQAQILLSRLSEVTGTIEEVGRIRDTLVESLQTLRINRAHDAFRLAELQFRQHRNLVCKAYSSCD